MHNHKKKVKACLPTSDYSMFNCSTKRKRKRFSSEELEAELAELPKTPSTEQET